VEIESLEEGRESAILKQLINAAVLTVFKQRVPGDKVRDVIAAFDEGAVAHVGEDIPSAQLSTVITDIPALREPVLALTGGSESPALVASAVEFVFEGLHLNKRLNKDSAGSAATYRSRA
jgi:magnesium chelatase subunit I